MGNRQTIKAWNGKILGSIETDYQGNKIRFINTIIMLIEEKEKRIGYY